MSDSSTKLCDLPRDERLLLMRFVCSFAWADHEVQPEERALVARFVERLELHADEIAQVNAWLEEPPAPASVDPGAIPEEHRMLFLRAIESIITVDGDVSAEEREALLRFAKLQRTPGSAS